MSKMEYMPVDCLQVPKMLFQMEKYKNLSNTAKILYSLFLDRLKFAVQNGWVDHNGDLFVIYPKSEMKKDLNTTRYGWIRRCRSWLRLEIWCVSFRIMGRRTIFISMIFMKMKWRKNQ